MTSIYTMQSTEYLLNINQGLTKAQIAAMSLCAVETIMERGTSVLQVAESLSAMELFIKEVKGDERYTEMMLEELGKHNGKATTPSGAKIEACEAGVRYDYSQNPEWVELDRTIALLKVKKEQLEMKLRAIPPGKLQVDTATGETLVGASKSSKSTYKVTLKK